MSAVREVAPTRAGASRGLPFLPKVDVFTLGIVVASLVALYLPSYLDLARTVWTTDEQGHGPIIFLVSLWLIYQQRFEIVYRQSRPTYGLGFTLLVLGLAVFALGRTQSILLFEISSQIVVLCALVLLFLGRQSLRAIWFPLFFMVFMVPLPEALVAAVTAPLKSAVSAVASSVLYSAGYPIARAGVILSIGPYQLLVADACAGLNSMFTLEALGLLYMNLMRHTSIARNAALALLVIPISFLANVVRVVILVLVTYYLGDEAGQGFVHGFAGMVLFLVGLVLMLATDKMLGLFMEPRRSQEPSK
jgi:exosortase B